MNDIAYIENKTYDEISEGDTAEMTRVLSPQDIDLFAVMSGDVNPAHLDEEYAEGSMFKKVIAHGMWGGALISAVLGTQLPGPGTIYLKQALAFRRPVCIGDTITVRVTVLEKGEKGKLTLGCECLNQEGEPVIEGQAQVIAPREKVRRPRAVLPDVHMHERGARYREIIARTRDLEPITVGVVHPCDPASISGALAAAAQGIITPVLIGPRHKIEAAALEAGLPLTGVQVVATKHSHAAIATAVAMAKAGELDALMKGALDTLEFTEPIKDPHTGLGTARYMTHAVVMDVPHYPKPLIITDAALIRDPTLAQKKDIIQNAIDLAHALGIATPKVALLSAVERVLENIPSTVEAAALWQMANRGQITGGIIDGPIAFENAISSAVAEMKGLTSPVAGDADILIAPGMEAGNIMAKQLIYLSGAEAAGLILGAQVPVILTSRASDMLSRLVGASFAQLMVHYKLGTINPAAGGADGTAPGPLALAKTG